jgi:hypothetical protein
MVIGFQDAVLEELGSYDSNFPALYYPRSTFRSKRPHYWWPGSATTRQVFEVSYTMKFRNCNSWVKVLFHRFQNVIRA